VICNQINPQGFASVFKRRELSADLFGIMLFAANIDIYSMIIRQVNPRIYASIQFYADTDNHPNVSYQYMSIYLKVMLSCYHCLSFLIYSYSLN
jgi:hypothetical protein